ncbi:rhamnogalacturonan acetylesterase RhgT [Halobacillus andaensis]|uniref:Rhamnogalacturonan acetylesterase RhgT n=1 Tax=Halobacillus andaensis TaxID=1176239 RepID=A0A917B5N0_HALAA|nr:rhamnogalacturonan acetylesterase [Halobacillus andaensis]MBP2006049.1 lysophospholipase L1-like esterase [Halobacillus andaensis]GGF24004.1 rhamnogalacturonan acetylesterase RhgT [Halobacillus andaensis]
MKKVQIFIAGDSTAANYEPSSAPQAGWGQLLPFFFSEGAAIHNKAMNGRSSKSFIEEGRLTEISEEIRENDYLLIQFGHNDSKPEAARRTDPFSTYQKYLAEYIDTARSNKATPVLLTPVQRRKFSADGALEQTHGDFPEAMRQLAQKESVHLIDMTELTSHLLNRLGPEESKHLFMWLNKNASANFPDGVQDDTHFTEGGAKEIARIVAASIANMPAALSHYVKI